MMSLYVGKPRAGKSSKAVRDAVEEIVHGHRTVVTQMPLKVREISAYIARVYPWWSGNLLYRIRLIDDAPKVAGEFWRYRGPLFDSEGLFTGWLTLPPPDKETGAVDYSEIIPKTTEEEDPEDRTMLPGEWDRCKVHRCFYLIDEAYNYYNARFWMKLGTRAIHYCSQHGKLGDTAILMTHLSTDIDKQMLGRFQDYVYFQNHAKENVAGIFRSFPWMSWKKYLEPRQKTSYVVKSGKFGPDPNGIGACYATDGGVGIKAGLGGDKGERAKGFPIWVAFLFLACLIPLGALIVPAISALGSSTALAMGPKPSVPKGNPVPTSSTAVAGALVTAVPSLLPQTRVPSAMSASGQPVSVGGPSGSSASREVLPLITGMIRGRKVTTLYFSDGGVEEFPSEQVSETARTVFIEVPGSPAKFKWQRQDHFNPVNPSTTPINPLLLPPMPVPSGAQFVGGFP